MKWPWRKCESPPPDLPAPDPAAAHDAARRAEEDRKHAEAQWPKVRKLSASLQTHREENHFAEMFTQAMQRRES